jgi:Ca2+-binding EF-hand superfamily protein
VRYRPEKDPDWVAAKRDLEKNARVNAMLEQKNKNSTLNRDELERILTYLSTQTTGSSPTGAEVDFIFVLSDRNGDGRLELGELSTALIAWKSYGLRREWLEDMMRKYDRNQTGKLEKLELKLYLTDLNEGIVPTEAEVQWVLSEADLMGDGAIRMQGLDMATQSWYSYMNKHQGEDPDQEETQEEGSGRDTRTRDRKSAWRKVEATMLHRLQSFARCLS